MIRKTFSFILYNILVVGLLFGLVEGTFSWFLHHPDQIPDRHVKVFHQYYMQELRNILQYDPAYADYDSTLFYRWIPGQVQQKEIEFKVQHQFNSQGFRDDESSLEAPEILFLGDSYTMGWGVEQDQTFESLIEQKLHKKCLNMGVSSYGTVREIYSLDGIDTSKLECIVIQYCGNDLSENQNYALEGNRLKVSSPETYANLVETNKKRAYYLFKHSIHLIPTFLGRNRKAKSKSSKPNLNYKPVQKLEAAPALVNVLISQSERIPDVPILLFSIDEPRFLNPTIENFEQIKTENPDSLFYNQFHPVYPDRKLEQKYYYLLDQHLKPSGHEAIADFLVQEINRIQ